MKRLDQYIYEKYQLKSRSYAGSLIMAGKVLIKDTVITKAGFNIKPSEYEFVKIKQSDNYVGWGANKLLQAFQTFQIDLKNRTVLDIGSSTGGFTQVCLKYGARGVFAVDVGENQLDYSLRTNPQVVSMEKTNARSLTKNVFASHEWGLPQFVVVDVSFISLKLILPVIELLSIKEGVLLIKPQFEVGKEIAHFDGIVKQPEHWEKALTKVKTYCKEEGFEIVQIIESPSQNSAKKNKEFLAWIKKES